MIRIESCPFCGNADQELFSWQCNTDQHPHPSRLVCSVCRAEGPLVLVWRSTTEPKNISLFDHPEVVKGWNKRAVKSNQ